MNKKKLLFALTLMLLSCSKKTEKTIVIKAKNKESVQVETKHAIIEIQNKDTTDLHIGNINGYNLVYDSFGNPGAGTIGVAIYYKKGNLKKFLFSPKFIYGDYDVDDVSIFKYKNNNFIYIGTIHPPGQYQGYLCYLNPFEMKTYEVKIKYHINSKFTKIRDTLDYHRSVILIKDEENNFTSRSDYSSNNGQSTWVFSSEYEIIKTGKNKFILYQRDEKLEKE